MAKSGRIKIQLHWEIPPRHTLWILLLIMLVLLRLAGDTTPIHLLPYDPAPSGRPPSRWAAFLMLFSGTTRSSTSDFSGSIIPRIL
jgi:hypothetical protein